MGESLAFLTIARQDTGHRPVEERLRDYRDVSLPRSEAQTMEQASRCISCFLPFCHWGCPIGNHVADWNTAAACGDWQRAYWLLDATNNMPEVTGRICPAPCEAACVLNLHGDPVTNCENERAIVEHAFRSGWVTPQPPPVRTGKRVAIVGSGPAGLCCADQLNAAGHDVVVFERDDRIGGLLRYGIPDFKLEKSVLDRRLQVWKAEGIRFETGVHIGVDEPPARLRKRFDAICLTGGARRPRDLDVEGRGLRGIHFALEYLIQSNRRVAGEAIPSGALIDARGKRVVVIGGGDTGADCVGTAHRQGAAQVTQIEILPRPPQTRGPKDLWPDYPKVLRTSTSHEEGGRREWSVLTKRFLGERGALRRLSCVRVDAQMQEVPGSAFELDADLVLLALGFVSAEPAPWLAELGVTCDARGNIATDAQYQTAAPGVFAAGDMRRGQSLVVWAVSEGRRAAHFIDRALMGASKLPLV